VARGSDEPTDQAQAIMERVLRLVTDCRSVLGGLEHPGQPGESSSVEAERIPHFTLMSAIDAGLIRAMENALKVLRHAPAAWADRADWLEQQARALKGQYG